MSKLPDLSILETLEGYRCHFMDPGIWAPYARRLVREHLGSEAQAVTPAFAGSFPTFIVDGRWVVKLFGRLYDGHHCWRVEALAAQLLRQYPVFPTPAVLAQGEILAEGETLAGRGLRWGYLIFEFIPGARIAERLPQLSAAARDGFAFQVGQQVHRLHQVPLPETAAEILPSQRELGMRARARCLQNHRSWGALPERLIRQIPDFLLSTDHLEGAAESAHLIHADLTGDHFLGEVQAGGWQTRAVIDFGDAMIGHWDMELVALHLDLFRCDPAMLGAFLKGYGLDGEPARDLPLRFLRAALLHEFNVLSLLPQEASSQNSLPALAAALWEA